MDNNTEKLNRLSERLELLLNRQEMFANEIKEIQEEIKNFKIGEVKANLRTKAEVEMESDEEVKIQPEIKSVSPSQEIPKQVVGTEGQKMESPVAKQKASGKSDLEKFIGENLINKIGIAITVLGIAIGAKYSIDHDLISPLTRIILGYFAGLGLLGFGIKLKSKYENFSAVLISGAMAAMYFVTYAAYSFYYLIPQLMGFILMVIFTSFTVLASLKYNKQVISVIGMVGAYAVPLLLSEGTGKVSILFSYIALINGGILFIAFKKSWKLLYNLAFILTWFIYFFWYASNYQIEIHFGLSLIFLSIFYLSFYFIFLAYKIVQSKKLEIADSLLSLSNSFIFYGIGYSILNDHEIGQHLLGLFTLVNAIIHFIVSLVIYRKKLGDKNLFFFVSGLVLVFLTIAIPVQLDGNWVTLLWVAEALLLFWIGRVKNVPIYEKLSYPLMILAFFSTIHDWSTVYNLYDPALPETRLTFLLNINYLSSLLFIACFSYINIINRNNKYTSILINQKELLKLITIPLPTILIFTIYAAFYLEIRNFWDQLFVDSALTINIEGESYSDSYFDYDLLKYRNIWIVNYSLLFMSVLSWLNIKKIRNQNLSKVNFGLNAFVIVVFLIVGLYELGGLRTSYLNQSLAEYYNRGISNIYIRYISLAFTAGLLFIGYKNISADFMKPNYSKYYDYVLYSSILVILSSELFHWMDIAESSNSTKLGLSILWGTYSLFIIILGIRNKKKHLRISAIILFAITLFKLFFYDLIDLDTISKTIIFIVLGILLLIISFFYNKYKQVIYEEIEN